MPVILITMGGHAGLRFYRRLRSHIARMTLPHKVALPQAATMGRIHAPRHGRQSTWTQCQLRGRRDGILTSICGLKLMRIGFSSPHDFIAAGDARSLGRGRKSATKSGECTILMENPIQREERHRMPVPDFHGQLALLSGYDTGTPLDVLICRSLFDKDAPRDYFTLSIASPNTPSPMYLARERTDSEKAVKGSKEATMKELAGQSPNYSNDELYRRETEVRTSWFGNSWVTTSLPKMFYTLSKSLGLAVLTPDPA